MNDAKIIAITKPLIEGINTGNEFIAYCARVSNPANQNNNMTVNKLIQYLMNNKHWSPFEMVHVVMEINTTRDIARQILRHRSFSFQEFCLTGDSKVTIIQPNGAPNYIEIEKLYKKRNWKNYKNLSVRVYDQKEEKFTSAKITEVFYTGKKPCYKFTLENGKILKCTKEEKVLSKDGFIPIEDLLGLELIGNKAVLTKEGFIGTNGEVAYHNFDWLYNKRNELPRKSLTQIANEASCSPHTIRKWLKKFKLQYTKKEVAEYTPIWNKGKFGYSTNLKHSKEHIESIKKARSGDKSNWWKGGVDRNERRKIADWCKTIRRKKLQESNFSCNYCKSHEKLELDHIIPVWERSDLAYNYENIQILCHDCHMIKHNKNERKEWRKKSKGNTLIPRFSKVVSVEYIGEMDTYDLSVDHPSHNFVADKIIVHNSQRYADPTKDLGFVTREARLQDTKNRQNSIETDNEDLQNHWTQLQIELTDAAQERYKWAIENGVAKEQARAVLPEGLTVSRMYMAGTLRSWLHYCQLRMGNGTQKEHRDVAISACNELEKWFDGLINV